MIIQEPEKFRHNIVEKINTLIQDMKKSINIEKSIFNYSIRESNYKKVIKKWDNEYFVMIYMDKFRMIWFNLKDKNNKFLDRIMSKEIECKKVGFLTHQELYPDNWSELIDAKMKRDKNKYEDDTRIATSEFKCRKCNKRICTYYQLQTRSADEPITTFVQCLNCNNRWKC